jgi:hypothetical protein
LAKLQLTIRVDEEVIEKLRKIAEMEHRSLNGQIESFLQEGIDWFTDSEGVIRRPYDIHSDSR